MWEAGDVSLAQTLTDDDHLRPVLFNELRAAITSRVPVTVAPTGGDYATPHAAVAAGETYVVVTKADYSFTTKLSIPSGVIVECQPGTVFQQANGANIANSLVDIASNAGLSWVTIDGNKANNLSHGRGITIAGGSNSFVEHVVVLQTRDHAINIRDGAQYNTISHVYCEDIEGAGVVISGASTWNYVDNVITKTATNSGVYITSSDHNFATNCRSSATYYGFDVFDSLDCSFEDCVAIDPTFDQFHVEDSQDVAYINCVGSGGSRDGLAVYSTVLSSKLATNITISNLQTKGAPHYGVNLVGTASLNIKTVSIMGGDITDATGYGIYSTYTNGLHIGGGVMIDGNGGGTYDGIRLDVGTIHGSIGGAHILSNGGYAIRIQDASVDDFQIGANTYSGNGVDGILNNSTGTISSLNPKLDIIFDATAARAVRAARHASSTGTNLTIQAGGAVSAGTNTTGGSLILSAGIATGTARSAIQFNVPTPGSSGTADNTPTWAGTVWQASANGPVISLAANSSTTGLPLSSNAFAVRGNVAGGIVAYRHTTTNSAGNNFTTQAGGATSGATNKDGGTLVLKSGISTGTGLSQILLQTPDLGSTGTTDNGYTTRAIIDNNGLAIAANHINVSTAKTPSSASDTGTAGDIAWDTSFIYVCTATNTWKRVAIATW